ncbi:MAG: hypothetical protein QXM37_00430 [Candidatus Bathyarchaeia archaeon]
MKTAANPKHPRVTPKIMEDLIHEILNMLRGLPFFSLPWLVAVERPLLKSNTRHSHRYHPWVFSPKVNET